jgi:hypothetical protein
MMARVRDRPLGLLTRHFFRALFDFGVFTQEGADAFVRLVIGLISLIVTLGLLLVYMYAKKYAALFSAATGQPYAEALLADTTLAIALPMWMVAVVTVLVSHSLFPDETDFRVLMPLPVDRGLIFRSKLLALTLFGALFAATTHAAVSPLVLLISAGRWAEDAIALSFLAFWAVSVPASLFALLTVVAISGAVITCIPRSRVHVAVAVLRSAMLGALVLALPLVMALPTQSARLAQHSRLLLLAPPTWFMGVERVLLGHDDRYFLDLARAAAMAFAAVSAVTFGCYVVLYRRFDRVMLHAFGVSRRRWFRARPDRRPARAAVRDFTAATLRRSALHQGVVIALSTCGVALALNGALRHGMAGWLSGADVPARDAIGAVTQMPFPLIVVLGIAAKASLALPIEPKANWVFQLTERDAIRGDQLNAAERLLTLFATVIPVVFTAPFQWLAAGPRAVVGAAMTSIIGLLWVEVLLRDWQRIPFTCSYMPGKHTVAQSSLAAVGIFVVGGAVGGGLEFLSLRAPSPAPALLIAGALCAVVAVLRRQRHLRWQQAPLMFDDELPSDVLRFRLD